MMFKGWIRADEFFSIMRFCNEYVSEVRVKIGDGSWGLCFVNPERTVAVYATLKAQRDIRGCKQYIQENRSGDGRCCSQKSQKPA